MAKFRELDRIGSAVRFVNLNSAVNTARLPDAITSIRSRFSFLVEVTGTDEFGLPTLQNINVATDNAAITPAEIKAEAIRATEKEGEKYQVLDGVANIQFGMQRASEFG